MRLTTKAKKNSVGNCNWRRKLRRKRFWDTGNWTGCCRRHYIYGGEPVVQQRHPIKQSEIGIKSNASVARWFICVLPFINIRVSTFLISRLLGLNVVLTIILQCFDLIVFLIFYINLNMLKFIFWKKDEGLRCCTFSFC